MKYKFQFLFAACLVALATAFVAFTSPKEARSEDLTTYEDESGNILTKDSDGNIFSGSDYYSGTNQQKVFRLDTLTTAGTTTVLVPWNMASPYQYQYFFRMRKIGVTPNVKVVLDERNAAASAIWSAVDSVSMVGADSTKLNFRLRGSLTYGTFHRLRFVKVGNGAVARNIELVIKATD